MMQDLVANQHDGHGVGLAVAVERASDAGQPVLGNALKAPRITHRIHHADHIGLPPHECHVAPSPRTVLISSSMTWASWMRAHVSITCVSARSGVASGGSVTGSNSAGTCRGLGESGGWKEACLFGEPVLDER